MKHVATQWIRTLAIGVVLAGLMATPGPAQDIDGVKLEKWSTSPSNVNQADITGILDNGTLFVDGVNAGWRQARGPACTQLRQALGKSDMIGRGVTLYNIDCRPAPAGSLQVRRMGDEIRIDYLLRGNTVQFTSTTPTLLGKYADPRVSVDFDLALAARIKIPSLTQPLVVESAVADPLDHHERTYAFTISGPGAPAPSGTASVPLRAAATVHTGPNSPGDLRTQSVTGGKDKSSTVQLNPQPLPPERATVPSGPSVSPSVGTLTRVTADR